MCVLLAHDVTALLHQVAECETAARKRFITAEVVKQSLDAGLFLFLRDKTEGGRENQSAFSSFAGSRDEIVS